MKKTISLQHGWQTEVFSGGAKNYDLPLQLPPGNLDGQLVLKNTFVLPDDENGAYYLLLGHLSGAFSVTVDGRTVSRHESLFAPYACELTDYVQKGGSHEVCLTITPCLLPAGCFTFGSAEILCVNRSHFDYTAPAAMTLTVRTEVEASLVNIYIDAHLVQPNNYDILQYRLFDPGGREIHTLTTKPTSPQVCVTLPSAALWESGNTQYRYRLTASLHRDNVCIDATQTSFGIRDIRLSEDGFLTLNGIRLPLCGVFLPAARGTRREIMDLAALGGNCLMLDTVYPNEELLDACDRHGVLVALMTPYARLPGGKEELLAIVRMLSVHPCVCFFAFRAEDITLAKSFAAAVHAAKTGALTIGSTEILYQERFSDDVSDILLLEADFESESASQTEFENRYLSVCRDHPAYRFAVLAKPPARLSGKDAAAQQALCDWHEKFWRMFGKQKNAPVFFAGELYDGADAPGLIRADADEKRDCFWFYRAQFSAEPTLHICGADDVHTAAKKISLKCYATGSQPRLLLRGKERKKQFCDQIDAHTYVFRDLKLRRGNNTVAVLSSDGEADSTVFRR